MKRFVSLILACLLVFTFVAANAESTATSAPVDVSTLSVEQLQALRDQIDQRLLELGAYYVDIDKSSQGVSVINLQKRLIELGYLSGTASGKWDGNCQKAMKAFEAASGLKQDGLASAADQEAAFSASAQPKPTPTPKPTPKPTATPKPTPTPDPLAAYGKYDYEAVFRNPELYLYNKVKVRAKVIQSLGSRTEGFTLRVATRGNWDNVIMVYVDSANAPDANILEGDKLNIYGWVGENYTYTSTMGAEITVPLVYADVIGSSIIKFAIS